MIAAVPESAIEGFRPLLPVGYDACAAAYREAALQLTTADLTHHYTDGQVFFRDRLVPYVKACLTALSGGAFQLDDYVAFAAGSDCDFISHLVEAVAAHDAVRIFPGDWFGFRVGCTQQANIEWSENGRGAALACLCVPSVRNGHVSEAMVELLAGADACLLNLNLYPTLRAGERHEIATALAPVLPKAVLSISFSRGFGLTASQLAIALVRRDHPFCQRFAVPWAWHSYYFNALAARAFMAVDLAALAQVDDARRAWVSSWLDHHDLPVVDSGSYYVKAFRPDGELPTYFAPLQRDGLVRLCFKPPHT